MKLLMSISVLVFGTLGSFVPYLWGDTNFFGGWSILFSVIGGFFGVWVGYKLSKAWLG